MAPNKAIPHDFIGSFPLKPPSEMDMQISWAMCRRQYLGVQELEAAQLPLVLQLTEGPIQEALSLPHNRLKLIREMLSHLELRKHNAQIKMELLSLSSCSLPRPSTASRAYLSLSITPP